MKPLFLLSTGLALALTLSPMAKADSNMNGLDQTFVPHAAGGGLAEIKFGQLAASQGASEGVRQFGQQMVQDHTAANQQLTAIAKNKPVDIPGDMDHIHKVLYDKLKDQNGMEFDNAYIKSHIVTAT